MTSCRFSSPSGSYQTNGISSGCISTSNIADWGLSAYLKSVLPFLGLIESIKHKIFFSLSTIRKEGLDPKNILIIGSYKRAERLIHEFQHHTEYGLRIRSILDPDSERIGASVDSLVVNGDMTLFKKNIKDLEIDEVFFAIDLNQVENIHEIFTYLDTIGVNYHIMINESVHTYAAQNLELEPVTSSYYGIPMLSFQAVPANYIKLYIKNGTEKIFAFFLLLFSLLSLYWYLYL